ncbi:cyanophycinase [Rufibacter glacialis]|uniref:Cyanophycinase n=1 Tax=Rufibacter glacialis TaxID=1259555 RepID=A0A5M8QHD0_9BACT|nr:cyanophycinase [Rufibacter glacialis]KAA6434561.1 cyanophycinase [Rufibacter glacialis]GGK70684.1 cyanophycinase [Rufibacter glacialis]
MTKKTVHRKLGEEAAPRAAIEYKIPKGTLIAIGGSENKGDDPEEDRANAENLNFEKTEILERFVNELSGQKPLVLVIPTASSIPEEVGKSYVEVFKKLKVPQVKVLDIRSREDACNPEFLELVRKAAGILFTGGDQLRLTSLLGGTEFIRLIKERYYQDSLVVAGTSAGAAAMSTQMIYQGMNGGGFIKGSVSITAGLELLNDVAIDTHFISRGRIVRMAQMIATNPSFIGIGLEEDTGVVVKKGNEIEVIGSGLVVLVDGRGSTHTNIYEVEEGVPVTIRDLKVHLLGKGDTYCLEVF